MMNRIEHTQLNHGKFHYIVRGVIRHGDHVLLCKQRTGDYTFLPGGHIEFGEPAKAALHRELEEEIGVDARIGSFVGAIENGWGGEFEISLVFEVDDHGLTAATPPQPASEAEAHLAFIWARKDQLAASNILPVVLANWLETGGWGSTL